MDSTSDDVNYRDSFKFETGIGPMTDRLLNTILDRLTTGNFKGKLTDAVLDPVTEVIYVKIKPYVYASLLLYSILIVLLVIIIYLLVVKKQRI